MKKILFALILAILVVGISNAAIDSTSGCYLELDTIATNVRVTGTAAGTIIPKRAITNGVEYVLAIQDSVGAAADSAYTTCIVYGSDGSTVMWSEVVNVHRAAGSRYQSFRLPIGITAFGRYFKVTFTRYNATNKTNVVRAELWKKSPVVTNIDYGRKR